MAGCKPTFLNRTLAGLFCLSLWRKGPLCCTVSCSCFNNVESHEAARQQAQAAKWKYESEKLAVRSERRKEASERRAARGSAKRARRRGSVQEAQPGDALQSSAIVAHARQAAAEAAVLQSSVEPSDAGLLEAGPPAPMATAAHSSSRSQSNAKAQHRADRRRAKAQRRRDKRSHE